jgi:hypothetical protein
MIKLVVGLLPFEVVQEWHFYHREIANYLLAVLAKAYGLAKPTSGTRDNGSIIDAGVDNFLLLSSPLCWVIQYALTDRDGLNAVTRG